MKIYLNQLLALCVFHPWGSTAFLVPTTPKARLGGVESLFMARRDKVPPPDVVSEAADYISSLTGGASKKNKSESSNRFASSAMGKAKEAFEKGSNMAEAERTRKELQQELDKLNREFSSYQQKFTRQLEGVTSKYEQSQNELQDLQENLSSFKREMNMNQSQERRKANELQQDKKLLEREVIDLRLKLEDANAELNQLRNENEYHQEYAEKEGRKRELLERYVQKMEKQVEGLQDMIERMSQNGSDEGLRGRRDGPRAVSQTKRRLVEDDMEGQMSEYASSRQHAHVRQPGSPSTPNSYYVDSPSSIPPDEWPLSTNDISSSRSRSPVVQQARREGPVAAAGSRFEGFDERRREAHVVQKALLTEYRQPTFVPAAGSRFDGFDEKRRAVGQRLRMPADGQPTFVPAAGERFDGFDERRREVGQRAGMAADQQSSPLPAAGWRFDGFEEKRRDAPQRARMAADRQMTPVAAAGSRFDGFDEKRREAMSRQTPVPLSQIGSSRTNSDGMLEPDQF